MIQPLLLVPKVETRASMRQLAVVLASVVNLIKILNRQPGMPLNLSRECDSAIRVSEDVDGNQADKEDCDDVEIALQDTEPAQDASSD